VAQSTDRRDGTAVSRRIKALNEIVQILHDANNRFNVEPMRADRFVSDWQRATPERKDFIMARTSTAAPTEPKTPAFQAYKVTNKGDDSFWTKVGSAWPHRDGKGLLPEKKFG
jgi:hypothetical protein